MKIKLILLYCGAALLAGCGSSANLAGLAVSANVLQNGQAIGVNLTGGTNTVTVGASYKAGTNSYSGTVTAPTN